MVLMGRILLLLTALVVLASCKKESVPSTSFTFRLQAVHQTLPVVAGNEVSTSDGRKFFLQDMRVYICDIVAVKASGERVPLKDVFLFRWGVNEAITMAIPPGDYDSLLFGLGLSPDLNNSNPNAFPDSHPLSIAQDMFWPMLKYRFILMEGAVDTSAAKSGVVNFPLTYHLGADELFRPIAIPYRFSISEGEKRELVFPVELSEIFDGPAGTIDLRTHFSNHSTDMPKATIMVDNFAAQLQ